MSRILARRACALGNASSGKNRSLLDWSSAAVGVPNRLSWAFAAPSVSRSNEARRRTSVSTNRGFWKDLGPTIFYRCTLAYSRWIARPERNKHLY